MPRTYISIDIDFWGPRWGVKETREDLRDTLKTALGRRIPVIAVMNHQQLLREVNGSQASRLINVDEHSDLAPADCDELNCGTWVSYVRWRRGGEYLWIRNTRELSGSCNYGSWENWKADTDWWMARSEYPGKKFKVKSILRRLS